MLRWGKKHNWLCICWDFSTNLTFLRRGFRAPRDLFPCRAAWMMHLPGLATLQSWEGTQGAHPTWCS